MADFVEHVPELRESGESFVFLTGTSKGRFFAHGCVKLATGSDAFSAGPLAFADARQVADDFARRHGVKTVHVRRAAG